MLKSGRLFFLIALSITALLHASIIEFQSSIPSSAWKSKDQVDSKVVSCAIPYPPKLYLGLKELPPLPAIPHKSKRYLSLKEINGPMPHEYAKLYLKMKGLFNPIKRFLVIHIDKRRQRMRVYFDHNYLGGWSVSTARRGYWTPTGIFRPQYLQRMHYSRKYHHSPMPWSVFFKGGYAIHGTYSISHLGRPASHGCVRIHPRNAKRLYHLIRRYGKENTRIIIQG